MGEMAAGQAHVPCDFIASHDALQAPHLTSKHSLIPSDDSEPAVPHISHFQQAARAYQAQADGAAAQNGGPLLVPQPAGGVDSFHVPATHPISHPKGPLPVTAHKEGILPARVNLVRTQMDVAPHEQISQDRVQMPPAAAAAAPPLADPAVHEVHLRCLTEIPAAAAAAAAAGSEQLPEHLPEQPPCPPDWSRFLGPTGTALGPADWHLAPARLADLSQRPRNVKISLDGGLVLSRHTLWGWQAAVMVLHTINLS
ncbi:MAG: hypothetical protein FRX49_02712 [Trebouxia sp. A1-2]|nr:MAG: hypothetical protein FRX49_02712 [Trebouxia sp. A1-2]